MGQIKLPTIRGDQRGLILGKTNSGKSYVMRYLLKVASEKGWRIVIVDPKKDWQGHGNDRRALGGKGTDWKIGTIDHPVLVNEFDRSLKVQIFQPVEWDEEMNKMSTDIMSVGNTIIYFDEITQLVNGAHDPPRAFKILWTQGRALNVGAWCGTQRPVNIPVIVKDQAEIWLVFRLTRYEDRQVVEGHMPTNKVPEMVEEALPIRYFWYYCDEMDSPVKFAPLNIKKVAVNGKHHSKTR